MDGFKRTMTAIHCGMEGDLTILEAGDEETKTFLDSLPLKKNGNQYYLDTNDTETFSEVFDKCNIRQKREENTDCDDPLAMFGALTGQQSSQSCGCSCGGNCSCNNDDEYPDVVTVEVQNPLDHTFAGHLGYADETFDAGDSYIDTTESFEIIGAPDNARVIEMNGSDYGDAISNGSIQFDPQTMMVTHTFKMKNKAQLEALFNQQLSDECVAKISSHQLRVCTPYRNGEFLEVYADHDGLSYGNGFIPDVTPEYMSSVFEELVGECEACENAYEISSQSEHARIAQINTLTIDEI